MKNSAPHLTNTTYLTVNSGKALDQLTTKNQPTKKYHKILHLGKTINDPSSIKDIFADHFETVFTNNENTEYDERIEQFINQKAEFTKSKIHFLIHTKLNLKIKQILT